MLPGAKVKIILQHINVSHQHPSHFTLTRVCLCAEPLSHARLCHPMDCSPPGSSARGILQVRILEWVSIPLSRGSSRPRDPALQGDSLQSGSPGKPQPYTVLCQFYLFKKEREREKKNRYSSSVRGRLVN